MTRETQDLGRLISLYPISALTIQRAVFVAVLSFVFFLGMMLVFYTLSSLLYFLLATAFLAIYLITMIGIFVQKKSVLKIFEHGVSYKNFSGRWEDIEAVSDRGRNVFEIRKTNGETTALSASLQDLEQAVRRIDALANAHRR